MGIITRSQKGSPLTWEEMDNNFTSLADAADQVAADAVQVAKDRVVVEAAADQVMGLSAQVTENTTNIAALQGSVVTQSVLAAASNGLALLGYASAPAQTMFDESQVLEDYVALRAYTDRGLGVRIRKHGIAGIFERDASDTTSADNGGTIILDGIGRRWKRRYEGPLQAQWFGAVGDGVVDDGAALNLALAALRAKIMSSPWDTASICTLDGGSRSYLTTISLNATKLMGGWRVQNMSLLGKCAGKAVVDAIGSRNGSWSEVLIFGDQTNMPSVGMQAARALNPTYGFCDGIKYDNVRTDGWFATAALYAYGQEGTLHVHCKWWNRNPSGRCAALQGYDTIKVTSDYEAPMTGSTSFVNAKYVNTDFHMLLPTASITGISKATAAVVTAPGHPFVNGQSVTIGYVSGMTQINNLTGTVASATTNTFALTGVNSTAFGTYTSGGAATSAQSVPTLYFNRGQEHDFDTCYFVSYGASPVDIDFPDGLVLEKVRVSGLFEGSGAPSLLRFLAAGKIIRLELNTYNLNSRDSVLGTTIGAGTVDLPAARLTVSNVVAASAPLLATPVARFALLGSEVVVPSTGLTFTPTDLGASFTGLVRVVSGATTSYGLASADYRDQTQATVALTSATGALGSGSAAYITTRWRGNVVHFVIEASVTTVGTGAGGLLVTMPFTLGAASCAIAGKETSAGKMLQGYAAGGASVFSILNYDGTTAIKAGGNYSLSGTAVLA